jgi:beta-mannanase
VGIVALATFIGLRLTMTAPVPTIALGVSAENNQEVAAFDQAVGAQTVMRQWYQSWAGTPGFDAVRADASASDGALPLLAWEPWEPGAGTAQPEYALSRIVEGSHDTYIASFAIQVRDWGRPLGLRFLHELNAQHYPWCVGLNGNSSQDAVAAWLHVRDIFREVGADNVVWVWSVNVQAPGYTPYRSIYPGDKNVDWLGVDGYNGGSALPWGGWRSPEELFGPSIDELRAVSSRPLLITEVGSTELGGDKAQWIADLFTFALERNVRGVIWFEFNKETDWRVRSSQAATHSMRREAMTPGRLGAPPDGHS